MSPLPYAKHLRFQTLQFRKICLFRRSHSVKHEFNPTTVSRHLYFSDSWETEIRSKSWGEERKLG